MQEMWVTWRADLLAFGCLACCTAFAAACQVESDELSEGSAGSAAVAAPRFGEVYAVMQNGCGGGMSGCHITGGSAGLSMPDEDAAHAALVEVASSKCAGELRVVPGDADGSVLVQVLEGSSACAKPMPLGRDVLLQEDIDLVRAWIEAGAEP